LEISPEGGGGGHFLRPEGGESVLFDRKEKNEKVAKPCFRKAKGNVQKRNFFVKEIPYLSIEEGKGIKTKGRGLPFPKGSRSSSPFRGRGGEEQRGRSFPFTAKGEISPPQLGREPREGSASLSPPKVSSPANDREN